MGREKINLPKLLFYHLLFVIVLFYLVTSVDIVFKKITADDGGDC